MGPRIETTRLLLRPPEMSDAPDIACHAGEYDIAKMTMMIPHPYPLPAAEMWILMRLAGWDSSANRHLIVQTQEADGGEMCGMAGIFRRSPDSEWEIGYWIAKPFWGRGLATEAGQALIDYARTELAAETVTAGHYDDNPASGRVLEKLGFRYTGKACEEFSLGRLAKANCLGMTMDLVTA
ncbi:Protein N-acetyltransferase, RimJ/RimL family [Maricaulis salignorans]|uniref:Protein N-acetyltransferase, RimJ/RimL family n=3 Tax=Maricaulis salignorans TaxID=144026 RepID=A0A1G9LMG7_9PROT|nr:Protein N-acetyltransferase, RimJ/RimL family [Maricaulis salignorans]